MTDAQVAITVRRARPADAEAMAQLYSDEMAFAGVLQMPYPSVEMWRQRLEDAARPDATRLLLAAEVHGEVVGNAGIDSFGPSRRRAHAAAIGMCVAVPWQGRGVGSALMAALLDYADRWAGYLRLELSVYTDNERAIALYRKFGFDVEGTLRSYGLRAGCYVDVLAMARLHPHPPQIGGP